MSNSQLQDYAQKPQRNCAFMNLASVQTINYTLPSLEMERVTEELLFSITGKGQK